LTADIGLIRVVVRREAPANTRIAIRRRIRRMFLLASSRHRGNPRLCH